MLSPLYFGQEVPYVNTLVQDSDTALQELGPGYARWGSANADSRKASNDINLVLDRLSTNQRNLYPFPPETEWKLAKGGNCMAFEDVNAADFIDYAQHTAILCAFFLPQLAPHGGAPAPTTLGGTGKSLRLQNRGPQRRGR